MTDYTTKRVNGYMYGLSSGVWALLAATEPKAALATTMWFIVAMHFLYSAWSFYKSTR